MDGTLGTDIRLTTDAEIRDTAYGLWVMGGGRSPAKVSRLLAELGPAYETKPDTIKQWSYRHKWAERADEELSKALPGMRREVALNLNAQAVRATRIKAQMLHDYEAQGIVPDKVALQLVDSALSYAGFSPVGQDKTVGSTGNPERRGAITHLTEEQIARLKSGSYR